MWLTDGCTFSTVKIGFQRVHYKVNEGDGCVEVCAVILSGYLGHQGKISFRFTTASDTAEGVFVSFICTSTHILLIFWFAPRMHSVCVCVASSPGSLLRGSLLRREPGDEASVRVPYWPCGLLQTKLLGLKYTD